MSGVRVVGSSSMLMVRGAAVAHALIRTKIHFVCIGCTVDRIAVLLALFGLADSHCRSDTLQAQLLLVPSAQSEGLKVHILGFASSFLRRLGQACNVVLPSLETDRQSKCPN